MAKSMFSPKDSKIDSEPTAITLNPCNQQTKLIILSPTDSILGAAGLVLTAISLVLLWFIILSGITGTAPLDRTYFLRADTSDITGARDITQWNFFYFCGEGNTDCGGAKAAPAFGAAWSSNPTGAPSSLVGGQGGHTTSTKFYYLWRFGWVMFILTLFFETLSFFSGFLACCGRLGAAIAGLLSFAALFFSSIAMSLMT